MGTSRDGKKGRQNMAADPMSVGPPPPEISPSSRDNCRGPGG